MIAIYLAVLNAFILVYISHMKCSKDLYQVLLNIFFYKELIVDISKHQSKLHALSGPSLTIDKYVKCYGVDIIRCILFNSL